MWKRVKFVWKKYFFVWKRYIFVWKKALCGKEWFRKKFDFCVEKRYFCVEKKLCVETSHSNRKKFFLCGKDIFLCGKKVDPLQYNSFYSIFPTMTINMQKLPEQTNGFLFSVLQPLNRLLGGGILCGGVCFVSNRTLIQNKFNFFVRWIDQQCLQYTRFYFRTSSQHGGRRIKSSKRAVLGEVSRRPPDF